MRAVHLEVAREALVARLVARSVHLESREALVKSIKRALKVMLGNVLTVDEVFLTVNAGVETMLNSRLLVYGGCSDSPTGLSVITSNHFLPGRASSNVSPGE
jgi:vacuolar-type H+-ATPase subunit E/Vma4